MRKRSTLNILLLVCLFFAWQPGMSAVQAAYRKCFPNQPGIKHCLENELAFYWEQNGALPVFGYPISAVRSEANADQAGTFTVQWTERYRLEIHPENANTSYHILLGRLGVDRLIQLGRNPTFKNRESGSQPGCLWFEVSGHNVCDQGENIGFKTYWETHGLQLPGLDPYQRSLQLFGYPLTEPRLETNSSGHRVMTQWFERARFEWHPDNPEEYKVLLGRLGHEVQAASAGRGKIAVTTGSRKIYNGNDLYIINPDGSGKQLLATIQDPTGQVAWSPDAQRIAFATREGLYTINVDGSQLQQIIELPITTGYGVNYEPGLQWSPDGRRIAFASNPPGGPNSSDIYVINADGSQFQKITTNSRSDHTPKWSPDGHKIAYISDRDDGVWLCLVNPDGSQFERLLELGGDGTLDWSPDGKSIAVSRGQELVVIDREGGAVSTLDREAFVHSAQWSPDGRRLLYLSIEAPGLGGKIKLVNADGSGLMNLSADRTDLNPVWSPDGKMIAFQSYQPYEYAIYTMRTDGSNVTRITEPAFGDPVWSPK